jgi:hypothetical membrane protein
MTRVLAIFGLIGIACFIMAVLALHLLQPQLSPVNEAMSYYVHGPQGWLISFALVALGVGSLALTVSIALEAVGASARFGVLMVGVWGVGAVLGGVFAADPPGQWHKPPSVAGAIHGIAALIALTALPIGAVSLSYGSFVSTADDRSRAAAVFATATAVAYIAFMVSLLPVMIRPGPPVLLGFTQRILFVAYLAWLGNVAIEKLRARRAERKALA